MSEDSKTDSPIRFKPADDCAKSLEQLVQHPEGLLEGEVDPYLLEELKKVMDEIPKSGAEHQSKDDDVGDSSHLVPFLPEEEAVKGEGSKVSSPGKNAYPKEDHETVGSLVQNSEVELLPGDPEGCKGGEVPEGWLKVKKVGYGFPDPDEAIPWKHFKIRLRVVTKPKRKP